MAIQLQKTSQAIANNGVKMLVYGPAGAGKTTLAGTYDPEKTIILSAEGGMLTLADKEIDVVEIRDIAAMKECFRLISSPQGDQYDLVVLDSISEMAEVCLEEEMEKTPDGRRAYGELYKILINLIRAFRDLPKKHVLLIAKQERIKNEADGSLVYSPSAPGQKLPAQLPYQMDVVMALRAKLNTEGELIRKLQTIPGDGYDAKDRSRQLSEFEDPDLTVVINKIMGGN